MKETSDYTSKAYWSGIIKMSLSKFFILRVLNEQPMHGYEIAQTVATVTKGCCTPTEGTIYPVLRDFHSRGCVEVHMEKVNGRERKIYTLTEKGRRTFEVALEAWKEASSYVLQAGRAIQKSVR
jgi:DNA-binding PadR family transcriptional regulator